MSETGRLKTPMRPRCTLFLQLLCLLTTSHTVCAFQLPPTACERSHCVHKPHAQSRQRTACFRPAQHVEYVDPVQRAETATRSSSCVMSFTWSPLDRPARLTRREVFEFSDDIVKALVATDADAKKLGQTRWLSAPESSSAEMLSRFLSDAGLGE